MLLNKDQLVSLSQVAIEAAKQAGRLIADYAGKDVVVEKKTTEACLAGQVVTDVDRQSQDIILKALAPTCRQYDLGLLAEESKDDLSRLKKDFFWCVDPMDGTLPFIESRPGYAVSIGLVSREGVPYIGVIYDPLQHTLYHAIKGVGAFRNEKLWDWTLPSKDEAHETIDHGGAVMNACWVLEKRGACFYKSPKSQNGGGCLWDYAASACLFETMGAWVSDIHGQPLELNRQEAPYMNHKGVLYASNRQIAKCFMR